MQRTICLPFSSANERAGDSSLSAAFSIAQQLGASVEVVIHELEVPSMLRPFGTLMLDVESMARQAEADSRKTVHEIKERLQTLAATYSTSIAIRVFRSSLEMAGAHLAEHSRLGGLCVVAGAEGAGFIEELIFGSGGPVLLLPHISLAAPLHSVALAWDGSRVAARTLRDSMLLLSPGAHVHLLTITQEKRLEGIGPDVVAGFLERHGLVVSQVEAERDASETIGAQLQRVARTRDASLLAMGAYGHQRLYEFILGGATRSVLNDLQLPILMSH